MVQGWGSAWGEFPWGGVASVEGRIVQKIIAVMKTDSTITKYVGSGSSARIYGGYPTTINDAVFPAIGIDMISSPGRMLNPASMDEVNLAISVYMRATGKNAKVWDDACECFEAIVDLLHHGSQSLFDKTIGVRILNLLFKSDGGQSMNGDLMVYSSTWNAIAQVIGIS